MNFPGKRHPNFRLPERFGALIIEHLIQKKYNKDEPVVFKLMQQRRESMEVDIKKFTEVLTATAEQIKEASDVVQTNPAKAMTFIPGFLSQIMQLQGFGTLSDISASIRTDSDKTSVQTAIQTFLDNSKTAQEKAGVMGAAIFANPQFQALRENLEQVKNSLDRGKRVERTEEGHGL